MVHEAESATSTGSQHERNADAVSVFMLGVPNDDRSNVVLAVADGRGWSGRGGAALASAVAVNALRHDLTERAHHLEFTSPTWQTPVAQALTSAFEHANAMVRELLDNPGSEPSQGVALTVAALLGNWLCVAHAGDCRAYRLSGNELAQVTADDCRRSRSQARTRRVRALGLAAHLTPALRFFRLNSGDVVLVCSDGLCRRLSGQTLARLMGARRPLAEIALSLVTAAGARGGDDDMSACLARVGRLIANQMPDPAGRPDAEQVDEAVTLPRYHIRAAAPLKIRGLELTFGTLALVGGLVGGWWLRQAGRIAAPRAAVVNPAPRQQREITSPVPPSTATPVAPLSPPLSATPDATTPQHPATMPGISPDVLQRRQNNLSERHARESLATERQQVADQGIRESLIAAQQAAAAAAEQEQRQRRETQARADREAAASAITADQLRRETLAAGQRALSGWVITLVSSINAHNAGAPVLVAGPASFAAFVDQNGPTLSGARLLTAVVNAGTAEATAEWVVQWRTVLGTPSSRRMSAAATAVLEGDTWRLRDWRITGGAP